MNGTIENRDAFINKIAKRLGRDHIKSEVESIRWHYRPQDKVLATATQDELLEVLKKQCSNIHTNIFVTDQSRLPAVLTDVVSEYGGGPIIKWKDDRFEEFGLLPLFLHTFPKENIEVNDWDPDQAYENITRAEKANIGITISDITLAESGTVVLLSSKNKGRSVSFLPLKSIMIIPKSTLVPRMTQAAQMLRDKVKAGEQVSSCINFITGPSNSADIEMNLVVGVHGPVKATYIVVEDR